MPDSIVSVLMKRDGLTKQEADKEVSRAKEELQSRIANGDMPFDLCEEMFGLEPDYLEELMF